MDDGTTGQPADIAVLIVAYRSAEVIGKCLAALEGQTRRPREVFLLENGSPPGERVDPQRLPSWVTLVDSDTNLGFAGGNNRLAGMAQASWLALLNPDAFAHSDWIEQFEHAVERYPGVSMFGSTQYAAGERDRFDGTGDCYHAAGLAYRSGYGQPAGQAPEGEVFAACGAAMFVRRELFMELGGFDESFFCYNEDVDLGFRARLIGQLTVQLAQVAVDHVGYGSSGRRSAFATYHGVRNRLWVFVKNTPGWLFYLLLPVHLVITLILWGSSLRYGQGAVFGRALRDALGDWSRIWACRRDVQGARTASVRTVAGMMSWSPLDLLTRSPKVRRWTGDAGR